MRMLVKRDVGTKGGLFGSKPQFQMTLKVQLTPEEQATVEKYGLQSSFTVENPVESKNNFTYKDFLAGKTMADTDVDHLLLQYKLYTSALESANRNIKNHQLFPGESIVEIEE